jgi:hypothetical protein
MTAREPSAKLVAALIGLACVLGVAYAQVGSSDGPFHPAWSQTPNKHDCWGNYPREERNNSIAGIVQLCCTPNEGRRLQCGTAFEWPQRRHFANASLIIARTFRLSDAAYVAYRADRDGVIQIPIQWEPLSPPRNLGEISQIILQRTEGICATSASGATVHVVETPVFRCPSPFSDGGWGAGH